MKTIIWYLVVLIQHCKKLQFLKIAFQPALMIWVEWEDQGGQLASLSSASSPVGWPCYAGAWILPWSVCSHTHCFAVLKVRELLTFPCCISATWKYIQYTGCNLERWKHWIFFCGNWTPDWQEPHFESCSSGELWVLLSSIQNWTPKKHLMTWWECHIGAVVQVYGTLKKNSQIQFASSEVSRVHCLKQIFVSIN